MKHRQYLRRIVSEASTLVSDLDSSDSPRVVVVTPNHVTTKHLRAERTYVKSNRFVVPYLLYVDT